MSTLKNSSDNKLKSNESSFPANVSELEEYYVIAERWLSDFNFFANELNFFEDLIEKNILFSPDNQYLNELKEHHIASDGFLTKQYVIRDEIIDHMKKLAWGIRGLIPNTGLLRETHESIREKIRVFVNEYGSYKYNLFHSAQMLCGNLEMDLLLLLKNKQNGPD